MYWEFGSNLGREPMGKEPRSKHAKKNLDGKAADLMLQAITLSLRSHSSDKQRRYES
jgi:hypothetical protein